jgi:hypothetical protein
MNVMVAPTHTYEKYKKQKIPEEEGAINDNWAFLMSNKLVMHTHPNKQLWQPEIWASSNSAAAITRRMTCLGMVLTENASYN